MTAVRLQQRYIFNTLCLLISAVLAGLCAYAFLQIIQDSFGWEDNNGLPGFYLLASRLSHAQLGLLTTSFALSSAIVGGSMAQLFVNVLPVKLTYRQPKRWLRLLLQFILFTAHLFFLVSTPIDTSQMVNAGFTLTDGTVATGAVTHFQYQMFFALGITTALFAMIILANRQQTYADVLISFTTIAAVCFTVYQFSKTCKWMTIAGGVILLATILLLIFYMRNRRGSFAEKIVE